VTMYGHLLYKPINIYIIMLAGDSPQAPSPSVFK
jgi:hypothetical protein